MRALRWLIALLAAGAWALTATPAYAAGEDTVDQYDVTARLDAEGYLHVTETIVLRFGADSGRHGLQRTLTVREPDRDAAGNDTGQDLVLKVDEVGVTSPSGAPDQMDLTYEGEGTRTVGLRIRVGDPNTVVSTPTATYVISYRVLGLVRSPGGVDRLRHAANRRGYRPCDGARRGAGVVLFGCAARRHQGLRDRESDR